MATRSSQRFDTHKIVQYCSTLVEPEALPKQGRTLEVAGSSAISILAPRSFHASERFEEAEDGLD
jgi:hypothetical protein